MLELSPKCSGYDWVNARLNLSIICINDQDPYYSLIDREKERDRERVRGGEWGEIEKGMSEGGR